MEVAPAPAVTNPARRPLLEVVNVSKRFPVRLGPLKKGSVSAVDSLFKGRSVKSVYFPQFVLQ